jgi:hypothetical protein
VLRIDLPGDGFINQGRNEDQSNSESMRVYCPKRDATYEVIVAMPDVARIEEIQQRLSDLLAAGAE